MIESREPEAPIVVADAQRASPAPEALDHGRHVYARDRRVSRNRLRRLDLEAIEQVIEGGGGVELVAKPSHVNLLRACRAVVGPHNEIHDPLARRNVLAVVRDPHLEA